MKVCKTKAIRVEGEDRALAKNARDRIIVIGSITADRSGFPGQAFIQ